MKVIPTEFPHAFKANGTFRIGCDGTMDVVVDGNETYVCCNECGEGYRFQFAMKPAADVPTYPAGPTRPHRRKLGATIQGSKKVRRS